MKFFLVASVLLALGHMSEGRIMGNRGRYDSFADAYSSMGDIDWGKRGGYDNWINPAYGYSSMADTEWGWKKRADDGVGGEDDTVDDAEVDKRSNKVHNSYYTPYRYRQPYTLASSSYMPYKPRRGYEEPQASIDAAAAAATDAANAAGYSGNRDTRSRNGDRQYAYSSMADMDWGWKRKRSDVDMIKRNLASLARGNELPYKFRARRVFPNAPNDADPFTYLTHQYNLINEQQAKDSDDDLQRDTRAGVEALARHGGVRPSHHGGK